MPIGRRKMAGGSSGVQGGVIQTYSRLRPVRRLQPQKWLSPMDRKHLFSSSSSSSQLSSTYDASPSDDSDFLPPERRKNALSKRKRPKPLVEKSSPSPQKKRKKKCLKKNLHKSKSPSKSTTDDKENAPLPKRSSSPPAIFTTPFKKYVTFRRKAPAPSVTMKTLGGKPKSNEFPLLSSNSLCDFKQRKKRKLRINVHSILNSSADTLSSPLQRTPLLSSTPSVQLTAMPRTSNSFVRQLALCEPVEDSVVQFCVDTDYAVEEEKMEAPSKGGVNENFTHSVNINPDNRTEEKCVTQHYSNEDNGQGSVSGYRSSINRISSNGSGSGVKCLSIKMSHGTPFCVLSPVLVSSSESLSVICLNDQPEKNKDNGSFFCASPELFPSEELPDNDECQTCNTSRSSIAGLLAGSPSAGFLKANSANKWKHFSKTSFQPVVRLYSAAVEEYLQVQSKVKTPCVGKRNAEVVQRNQDKLTPHDVDLGQTILPTTDLCLRIQPVVLLDRQAVPKYFEDKNTKLLDQSMPHSMATTCNSPPLQTGMKTPLVAASALTSRIQGSADLQETTTTGRKVCISGFSAKRWGNQRKKTAKIPQHLSFQDTSLLMFKEAESACGMLSPSLFSSSMLTSSFLNSTAVKDLNLSTESLSVRDPQKEHQRWARLRAALSLHRKKKVEAGFPSSRPADQKNGKSLLGNQSSLLLLSPFQSSLCCDDLTDAEKVLAECQQEKPIAFYQCLTLDQLHQCQKVGEGVYGEVFRTVRGNQHVALKVIPIEGSQKVNGEPQKSFAEILPEIIISKELSLLSGGQRNMTSGFIKLHSAYCVQGSYPIELLSAWDEFAEEKGTENDRPDLFGEEQLFMILEFEFGGDDLERVSCKLPSVSASRSILHQVTAALAVAEEELRFEHRDLHWGNILIEKCSARTLSASLQGETFNISSAGVQVKIIDYTLSRLDKDGLTVFCDLSTDEELFLGEGDLQFDVYRCMREENQNGWSLYRPHSNVLWLHYLCDKLLSEVQYVRKPTSAAHQKELRKLRDFRRDVRQFSSAAHVLRKCKLFN